MTVDELQQHKKLVDKELTKRVRVLANELGITKRGKKPTSGHIVDNENNNNE
jgi:hypothetical protein